MPGPSDRCHSAAIGKSAPRRGGAGCSAVEPSSIGCAARCPSVPSLFRKVDTLVFILIDEAISVADQAVEWRDPDRGRCRVVVRNT